MFEEDTFDSLSDEAQLSDEEIEQESLSNMLNENGNTYEFAMPLEVRDTLQALLSNSEATLEGGVLSATLPFGELRVKAKDVGEEWSESTPSETLLVEIGFFYAHSLPTEKLKRINEIASVGFCKVAANGLITYQGEVNFQGGIAEQGLKNKVRSIVDDARNICKRLQVGAG